MREYTYIVKARLKNGTYKGQVNYYKVDSANSTLAKRKFRRFYPDWAIIKIRRE